MSSATRELLIAADAARKQGDWTTAERNYLAARNSSAIAAGLIAKIDHNLALCALSRGDFRQGADHSLAALQAEPALWLAGLVHAKCLRGLGRSGAAQELLEALKRQLPDAAAQSVLDAELADILMNELGDPQRARTLFESPASADTLETGLTRITTGFYDSDLDSDRLFDQIVEFAGRYLDADGTRSMAAPTGSRTGHRIGLISPFFTRSPVFFFCIGALRLLARQHELIFFNRSTHTDEATAEFRKLATGWHDCAADGVDKLRQSLRDAEPDVLIDLGGWSDVMAMQALATRPARVLLKWVGGQSASTGMKVFDGFITDAFQSPEGSERRHTEPLLRLDSGYVTYVPPRYLPKPQPASPSEHILGIVANPAKISRQFLATLRATVGASPGPRPLRLRFIDRRMALESVRQRITECLGEVRASVEFVAPGGHADYLAEVGRLTTVVDTFPYSGGLTAVEALAMGVPTTDINPLPVGERLFCGCHAYAHGRYSRQGRNRLPPWMEVRELHERLARTLPTGIRYSYLSKSPRADHGMLAQNLHSTITDACKRSG